MKKLICLIFLLIFTAGCTTLLPKEKINLLNLGLDKKEIIAKVGKPSGKWQGYAQTKNGEKKKEIKIPFEIWEYYISGENSSVLLYMYKDQLRQIEKLEGHIIKFNKSYDLVPSAIPEVKFET